MIDWFIWFKLMIKIPGEPKFHSLWTRHTHRWNTASVHDIVVRRKHWQTRNTQSYWTANNVGEILINLSWFNLRAGWLYDRGDFISGNIKIRDAIMEKRSPVRRDFWYNISYFGCADVVKNGMLSKPRYSSSIFLDCACNTWSNTYTRISSFKEGTNIVSKLEKSRKIWSYY